MILSSENEFELFESNRVIFYLHLTITPNDQI